MYQLIEMSKYQVSTEYGFHVFNSKRDVISIKVQIKSKDVKLGLELEHTWQRVSNQFEIIIESDI